MLNELLWISLVLMGIQCQLTQLSLGDTESLVNESVSCACNFSTDFCDEFCCCDSQCDSKAIVEWDLSRKCTEKIYSSAYRIPECNRDYQKSSSDLYLGLRIAYNILQAIQKSGLCYRIHSLKFYYTNQNTLSTLQNKELNSKDYAAKIEEETQKYQTITQAPSWSTDDFINISAQVMMKMHRPRNDNDLGCQQSPIKTYKTYPVTICSRQLTEVEITSLLLTEFKYSYYESLTIWNQNIKISATYSVSYNDATKRYQYVPWTAISKEPVGKTNLVIGVIYSKGGFFWHFILIYILDFKRIRQIIPIDDTNITDKPISIDATIFIIDSIQLNADAVYIIPAISGIIYKTVKGEAYDISSKGGYKRGAPLRFKKSFESTNEELLQQLFIGVESYDGSCISNSIKDLSHSFQIKFLEDQKISCLIKTEQSISFSASNIYKNVAENLKYVARYGDSGSNNLSTDEWLQVSPCSQTENIAQFSLTFDYIVFGEKGKERFRINAATLSCNQISLDASNYEYRLYIWFQEKPNTWTHFKGPSPQLIGGLPDDILAPFINYG